MISRSRAIVFTALTAALTAALLWSPSRYAPSSCMSKRVLGLSCPGCGLTRAVTSAAHLELRDSVRFHAFGPFVLAAAVAAWALLGAGMVLGRDLMPDFGRPLWGWVLGLSFAALSAYWLARFFAGTLPP